MFYTTAVRVVSEGSNEPIPNVRVSLFDKDLVSPDDLLGTAETGADGEAHFRFTTDDFAKDEDALDIREFPELYAVVYGPDGSTLASTRDLALDNRPRRHITVTVPAQAARELGWVADGG
ncbi:MAG TPA: hypothetical protein VEW03_12940 [Longimicrobiaceae bacterium]|nr:hypothetical protein [Longimicrobiaceae bacterium]